MIELTEMLSLFVWTIISGAMVATGLALIGAQLAGRAQSAQTLVVSQASSLGVTAGLALTFWLVGDGEHTHFLALAAALIFGGIFYFVCEYLVPPSLPSRNSYYIGLFGLLLSLTYTLTALNPSLESHMAASFFGDLAVVSNLEAKIMLAVAFVFFGFLIWKWRAITALSFGAATFGRTFYTTKKRQLNALFVLGSLILICLAIESMGFLFTISGLFLPSLMVSDKARRLSTFTTSVAAIAFSGAIVGFIASLWMGRMPTVPAIAFAFVIFGLITRAVIGIVDRAH